MATIPEALAIAAQHRQAGRLEAAEQIYRQILAVEPDQFDALHTLGLVSCQQSKYEAGIDFIRRALALRPDWAAVHVNLGNALKEQGKPDEAVACYCRALELKADFPEAHFNQGLAFKDLGRLDEAADCFHRGLALKPDYADAHWNLATVWLLTGDWPRAWPEFEWRWQVRQLAPQRFLQPMWSGESLAGKSILLLAEQGLGDTIQFIRYASIFKQQGATVFVECRKPLLGLLESCPGIDQLIGRGDPLPAFDVYAPLLSLPGIFKTSPETVPARIPYIFPKPALVAQLQERLSEFEGFKVGITWQGDPAFGGDRFRSIPLRHFAPLAEIPGVRLVSLQKGFGSEQLAEVGDRLQVADLAGELDEKSGPFIDTAAVMKNIDLVITSDTAAAHLAGALGVSVWVALPFAPDWRWLLDRSDSPWYPTMRLFRQKERGNWQGVFEEIWKALYERLQSSRTMVQTGREAAHADGKSPDGKLISINVSAGELIDKITILEIKAGHFGDAEKLRHVRQELEMLRLVCDRVIEPSSQLAGLTAELRTINGELWRIEDAVRLCEQKKDFGPQFIELARSVYRTNDRRSELKRRISEMVGSILLEEKSYR